MDRYEAKLKKLLLKNYKLHSSKKRGKQKKTPVLPTTPVDESCISIREMKLSDKYAVFKHVADFRRDYYINVYKQTFRSWFTYILTGALLAVSLTFIQSKVYAICLPPLVVSVYLLFRINNYKRLNRCFTINDMEMLNQQETLYYKFKSNELRRVNQGVLLAFYKPKKASLADLNLSDLSESDLDTDNEERDDEYSKSEKNKVLVGYLIYGKQNDELETVAIKEICIGKDFRRRRIATCFIKKACLNLFREFDYRRVTFQVSNFHTEALVACEKKANLVNNIYSWNAYQFLPSIFDKRNVYAFNLSQLSLLK
jgi:hypothetical protein